MSHTIEEQARLLARVRRIKGQLEALERAISDEEECLHVLQQIAACRGAINGLMAQVLEGHICEHLIDPARKPTPAEDKALDDLAQVIKRYVN